MGAEDVLLQAERLAGIFRKSPEFSAYVSAKSAVLSDPGLARRLAEYKNAIFDYKTRAVSGAAAAPDFDEERVLSVAYSDLLMNERAREFLEREEAVFGLVNGVSEILGEVWGELELEL